jgi:DNA-binding NtrC family response regulator
MPIRLLLVEDEAPVQELVAEYLRGRGHDVVACGDGRTARGQLRGGFDLLITDLKLPDAEGIELVQEANALVPPLPALVVSGYATVENALAAVRVGAVDLLLKPFRLRDVHVAVQRALQTVARQRRERRRLAAADWLEHVVMVEDARGFVEAAAGLERLVQAHGEAADAAVRSEMLVWRRALEQARMRVGA